ncbi:MAG: hypothetical protein Q8P50_07445 [Bacillota bacterium]|nr:hypothetical protein [Bacillota bacterium]
MLRVYGAAHGVGAVQRLGANVDQVIEAAAGKFIRIGDFVRAVVATLDEAQDAARG